MGKIDKKKRDEYMAEHPGVALMAVAMSIAIFTLMLMIPVVIVILTLKAVL